jgi:hypothetical protein
MVKIIKNIFTVLGLDVPTNIRTLVPLATQPGALELSTATLSSLVSKRLIPA